MARPSWSLAGSRHEFRVPGANGLHAFHAPDDLDAFDDVLRGEAEGFDAHSCKGTEIADLG